MNKLIALSVALMLTGCALFKGDPDRPGYQEGRTAAFLYVATEPVQPPDINEAIRAGYSVMKNLLQEDAVDVFVWMEIKDLYPDTTPEFREFVFNFYKMARQRIAGELEIYPDVPYPKFVENFLQGVEDSLEDWTGE